MIINLTIIIIISRFEKSGVTDCKPEGKMDNSSTLCMLTIMAVCLLTLVVQ